LNAPAAQALGYALAVDRNSIELLGARLVVLRRIGDCDGVQVMVDRLKALAPVNERVRKAVAADCL
jgi:hypothetical protein